MKIFAEIAASYGSTFQLNLLYRKRFLSVVHTRYII